MVDPAPDPGPRFRRRKALLLAASAAVVVAMGATGQCPMCAPAPLAATAAVGSVGPDGRRIVTFEELGGYTYELPTEIGERPRPGQIPAAVLALDGLQVRMQGYMMSTESEDTPGEVSEFILLPHLLDCCFGKIPDMNAWVHVRLTGGQRVTALTAVPVEVTGRLGVGEEFQDDLLLGIYRIDATEVKVP